MIASLYQNGSTLVGVSSCAMRLIFDAETARRNHRFINCSARNASSSQNRSSFAQARFTFADRSRAAIEGSRFIGRDDSGVLWRVCLGNRWTKWSVQLKRRNGEFAPAPLIDLLQFLNPHGAIQTHFFHTSQTKKTGARHKIADATVLCRPTTRTGSA